MTELQDLLKRLDTTSGLSQWVTLHLQEDVLHFCSNCRALRLDEEYSSVTEEVLTAIKEGKTCDYCWMDVDSWRFGFQSIAAIADAQQAELTLDAGLAGGSLDASMAALTVLNNLSYETDPCTWTWREELLQKARRIYAANIPSATNENAKARAAAIAAASTSTRNPSGSEKLAVLQIQDLVGSRSVQELGAPYLLTHRKGFCLLQAPEVVVEALKSAGAASKLEGWLPEHGPTPFEVTTVEEPVLARLLEMWDPEDPLLGNLERLKEAVLLIR